MWHIFKVSECKRSSNIRFLAIKILFSIISVQASVICGLAPQAHAPTALATSHVSCISPFPPNNGISAPPAPATPGIVVINEVLSSPQSQWNCKASNTKGKQENAWIEIYNTQNQPLDLYTAHASIDRGQDTQHIQNYPLPFGSIIAAHGFLAFFPFKDSSPISLVRLTISQTVLDQISIPSLAPQTSYVRTPDGSSNWQITTIPTIASSNQYTTGTTKTGSATSTHTHTAKQKSKNTSGGPANDGENTDEPNAGVQPTWSAVLLPTSASNNAATDNTTQHDSPPSTPPADSFGPIQKILLTLLIVVFLLALLWFWRLYRRHT